MDTTKWIVLQRPYGRRLSIIQDIVFHIRNVMYERAIDLQGNLPKLTTSQEQQSIPILGYVLVLKRVILRSKRKFLLLSPRRPTEFLQYSPNSLFQCLYCLHRLGVSVSSNTQKYKRLRVKSLSAINFSCLNNLVESVHTKMF